MLAYAHNVTGVLHTECPAQVRRFEPGLLGCVWSLSGRIAFRSLLYPDAPANTPIEIALQTSPSIQILYNYVQQNERVKYRCVG